MNYVLGSRLAAAPSRWPALDAAAAPVVVGVGAFALTLGLAAANGGFFPTSWGWSALAALWAAALALVVRTSISLRPLELVFLGALTALVGWIWLSLVWTSGVTGTVLEGERALVLLAAVLAVLAVARGRATRALLAGLGAAGFAACLYGLGTRLLPERLGSYDPLAAYRLAAPVGYWNGLGLLAAIGASLSLAFALRGRTPVARALGGFAVPVVLTALYFTFSRGSIIAFGIGLAAALVLDPRRLQLASGAIVLAVPAALGILLASRSDALTHRRVALAQASHEGHRLAVWLVVLAFVSALLALGLAVLERRLRVPTAVRLAFAALLAFLALAGAVGVFVRYGSPQTLARKGYHAFRAPPQRAGVNLNKRLFDLSGNRRVDLWRAAWRQASAHPALGGGAGSYERYWLQNRSTRLRVEDAHSLYLETLAELGPPGLALLVALLCVPLVAAVRARHHPLVPFAFAGLVAYLVHAAVDWDWELPAVTLAALLCGLACILALRSRKDEPGPALSTPVRAGALLVVLGLAALMLVALLGNAAAGASSSAAQAGRAESAVSYAHSAIRWAPWSSIGWQQLGEAQLQLGERGAARHSLRRAIAKDPHNWVLWLDLASAERGAARDSAVRAASRLNPLAPEIQDFVSGS